MQVNGLNHINIVSADLDATVDFYEKLLDMTARPLAMAPAGLAGRHFVDSQGEAIIHVQAYNPERHGDPRGGPTGTIDHIALNCVGFEATCQRCDELGIAYRVNDRQFGDLRQIFVTDPNNIALELNFAGD